jgi:hypothetical protein
MYSKPNCVNTALEIAYNHDSAIRVRNQIRHLGTQGFRTPLLLFSLRFLL